MDQPRIWKSRGHRESLNYPLKYTPFGLSKSTLGELNLVGFEEAVERIVKRVCKCHLETTPDSLFEKKQIESACQTESRPQIVCRNCKGLGHYSRDCEVKTLKSKTKSVEGWKSKVLTRTIGLQTDFL
jgi:hypothetical protein